MGYIYCITNNVNNKKYIGKTLKTVEKRWKEHLNDYKKQRHEKRALYDAMKKYGVENFQVETIGEFPNEILEEKEIFYIQKFKTYHFGYNLTYGGDGKQLYNYDDIAEYYISNFTTIVETAQHFNCHVDTVKDALTKKKIPIRYIKNSGIWGNCNKPKKIICFDLNHQPIQTFDSVSDAGKWLFEEQKCKTYNSGVRGHISDCANKKTTTAYGYIWEYE